MLLSAEHSCCVNFCISWQKNFGEKKNKKNKAKFIASIMKQDPNTQKVNTQKVYEKYHYMLSFNGTTQNVHIFCVLPLKSAFFLTFCASESSDY